MLRISKAMPLFSLLLLIGCTPKAKFKALDCLYASDVKATYQVNSVIMNDRDNSYSVTHWIYDSPADEMYSFEDANKKFTKCNKAQRAELKKLKNPIAMPDTKEGQFKAMGNMMPSLDQRELRKKQEEAAGLK